MSSAFAIEAALATQSLTIRARMAVSFVFTSGSGPGGWRGPDSLPSLRVVGHADIRNHVCADSAATVSETNRCRIFEFGIRILLCAVQGTHEI
ncbi:hypothetical protein BDN72DRAFT_631906 [Pluteus cervinus]|uniref:Uncharacterized protein n=1 Tax=Pluteus cervinus TaxID=181527 RepID=A0ACD3BAW8_9AGAR|nr:hypothetical protein BDN72DRAFT_631906 [Pluteus cervinus]